MEEKYLLEENLIVRLPQHTIRYSPQQEKLVNQLMDQFLSSPYTPPAVRECVERVGGDLFQSLLESGRLIQVSDDVVFHTEAYQNMLAAVKTMIQERGSMTVSRISRPFFHYPKVCAGILEHLDQRRITVREGDARKLLRTE